MQANVAVSAGQTVTVVKDGSVLATLETVKDVGNLVVATAGITAGYTYDVQVNGSTVATVTAGEATGGGMGGFGRP